MSTQELEKMLEEPWVGIELAQDGEHYIVHVNIKRHVWLGLTISKKCYESLKTQIKILDEVLADYTQNRSREQGV